MTITTTFTNFAAGEHTLQMPLTFNPVLQNLITKRGTIVQLFSSQNPDFYSRLSPADMVISLKQRVSGVMRRTVSGAVVLGIAAKSDGLTTKQLIYNQHNKWTVNVSSREILTVLTSDERHIYPFSDNITLTKLQNLGFRVLQNKYNISLENQAKMLYSSNATTFQSIQQDWIKVVNYITTSTLNKLAINYGVNVKIISQALNLSSSELHKLTLGQLDEILLKDLSFLIPTTTPDTTTNTPMTGKSTTSIPRATTKAAPLTPPMINLPTSHVNRRTEKSTHAGSDTTVLTEPTKGNSERGTTSNLALFVGVAAGLLLLLVASSSVWCFRRKRRNSLCKDQNSNKNDINMSNLRMDKTDNTVNSASPEEHYKREQLRFVRSVSMSTIGVDSRFKGFKCNSPRSSSTSFTSSSQVPFTRNSFHYDYRKEIFV